MPQVCGQCSRVNPPEASYCYYDGALLAGHSANGGPVNQGAQPFPNQFVLPSGQMCRNFDQLATACQQNWKQAVDLLKQGFLASFLGGLGRADLAMAAQEAARFPDVDRGLDQLLSKLPTQVLQPPKLTVEPSEINLGRLPLGGDRAIELHLVNQGMRLLYGSVVSDSKWLTLGEAPGNAQKLFQFGADTAMAVQIRGQHLRAGAKPLEGNLIIESNGGPATVLVRADVPVTPFPDGVLAGAISPRQIAEKARDKARDAAPLFENGAVAGWFTRNGWQYPVVGPSAHGLGAVQQFFEALGLAKAPKLEIITATLQLKGQVGLALQANVEVFSQEKRPVYAYGISDQPWLDCARPKLDGRFATIPVQIHVPNRPGEKLQGNVHVTGNGNQRFTVPVVLTVEGVNPFAFSDEPELVPVQAVFPPPPVPARAPELLVPVEAVVVTPVPVPQRPITPMPVPQRPLTPMPLPVPAAAPPPLPVPVQAYSPGAPPGFAFPASPFSAPELVVTPRHRREGKPAWVHLLPLGILALALLGIMLRDLWWAKPGSDVPIDPEPRIGIKFDLLTKQEEDDVRKGKKVDKTNTMNFGLFKRDVEKAKIEGGRKIVPGIRLTYREFGSTNSLIVKIDGDCFLFGSGSGKEEKKEELVWRDEGPRELRNVKKGMKLSWRFLKNIVVTQTAELIPGEPVEVGNAYKRLIDTCLIRYRIENQDNKPHQVSLRFLLDTLIGDNDEPLFTVPGLKNLVDSPQEYEGSIPDFVQALEKPDLKEPGVIARVNLRLSKELQPPNKVALTRWPGLGDFKSTDPKKYDIPTRDPKGTPLVGFLKDSAVVLYWNDVEINPNSSRELGFTYGLGELASKGKHIAISVPPNIIKGSEFQVVALVNLPKPNETLTLILPEGLTLMEGEGKKTQEVPQVQGRPSPVTWRVRAAAEGKFRLEVDSNKTGKESKQIQVRGKSVF